MNIAALVTARAALSPDLPAVIDAASGRVLTFADFEDEASAMAAALSRAGLAPGSRVLLLMPVSADLYVMLAALLRAGCAAVFIDPAAGMAHLGAACTAAAPDAFIGVARAHLLRVLCPPLRRIRRHFVTDHPVPGATLLQPDKNRAQAVAVGDDAAAVVRFTSGTTGSAKAAVRTHGFLHRQLAVLARSLTLTPGERDMVTMPMFVMANLAAGVTSILPRTDFRDRSPAATDDFIAEIHTHRPDRIIAAPALLERIADRCAARRTRLDSLRQVFTGGAAVFPRLLDKLAAVAPAAAITGVYGSTEAEPIALLPHASLTPDLRRRIMAGDGLPAGRPDPDAAVRIVDPDKLSAEGCLAPDAFAAACQLAGIAGEIIVSGPHVLPDYLDPAATAAHKLRVDGTVWHRTGDHGRLDPDGCLWLLGRSRAVVVDERGPFHPLALEVLAMACPGVQQAAAFVHRGRRFLCTAPVRPSRFADDLVDEIIAFPALPVDHRHQSRIDTAALAARIDEVAE